MSDLTPLTDSSQEPVTQSVLFSSVQFVMDHLYSLIFLLKTVHRCASLNSPPPLFDVINPLVSS